MPPEDDFRSKRVIREANNWSDPVARKLPERVTEREVMCGDVDR